MTINDIAKMAGVSVATVSRVMNNKAKGVGEETRQKVLKVIEECQYKPSAAARGLATKSSKIIGVVIPDITNPFYSRLATGVEDGASRLGYHTIICNGGNDVEKELSYIDFLTNHYVSGIIYNNFRTANSKTKRAINNSEVPRVYIDTKDNSKNSINMYIDNKQAMREMIDYLVKMGHRRIAFIGGPNDSYSSEQRYLGYKEALAEHGIAYEPDLYLDGGYENPEDINWIKQLFQRNTHITAVACCNDLIAVAVYEVFRQMGIKVGTDISVVGFDDIKLATILMPKLTTVHQPCYTMGVESARVLIDRIEGRNAYSKDYIFDTEIVIRDSVKKIININKA